MSRRLAFVLQEVISTEVASGNVSRHVLHDMHDVRDIVFNIALNTEHGTSGLMSEWQCVFNDDGPVPNKLDVGLSYRISDDEHATVHWMNKCSQPGQTRVISYRIQYRLDSAGMQYYWPARFMFALLD